MKIVAMVVVRNEADRYLSEMLKWTSTFVDGIFVFDDQSTDDSVAIAESCGAQVCVRPDDVPAFLEDEGDFRAAGWEWMVRAAALEAGDWVLALDADEFLVSEHGERKMLEDAIAGITGLGANALNMEVVEIFAEGPDFFYRRVDGWWGKISRVSLVAWQPNAEWPDKRMASGSVPTYANAADGPGPYILHLGYLRDADKREKYERYRSRDGHSSGHVESILGREILEPWTGAVPHT